MKGFKGTKYTHVLLISSLVLCFVVETNCELLSFFTSAVAGATAAYLGGWHGLKCHFYECCDKPYIVNNFNGLNHDLSARLHGQHLVKEVVGKHLKSHLMKPHSNKALVLSFHGWTGTGKNFVSKIVAENLFLKGMDSEFVKLFIGSYDFPFHDGFSVSKYKMKIQKEITNRVAKCGTSLFIFDEVDKAAPGVLDAIKPFIDFHSHIDGIDYRKAVFIFLNNAAGETISKKVYEMWESGIRDEITLKDLEKEIMMGAFNEEGGMNKADIIDKNLVSAFVPFLPLERKHLKLCIKDELKARRIQASDELVNNVADQLEYYPPDTKAFSKTGCKRVSEKVDLMTADEL